ncbi:MAG: 23S rRNA (uracil(1939)-C(5))-methyltransferase RlmD [Saccharofermentans sp.]|nr:23S rRNA (uracil(1939)-C(5))-methyltransferase RlmD [Saccharofermentans sp.]
MLSYDKELELKQKRVESLLDGLVPCVEPIIRSPQKEYYRNKVHAAFGMDGKKIIYGTYKEGTHKIIPEGGKLLENKKASAIIASIAKLASEYRMTIYDERSRRGFLRRVLVRTADGTGEILVVLVVTDFMFPGKKNFVKKLTGLHPEITSIVMNINRRTDSMILGDKSETIYGRGFIVDELLGLKFRISCESFYQINHDQCENLYSKALEYAAFSKEDSIIDAYCGTGTIGIYASKFCGKVTGVELNSKAVADAQENIHKNAIKNVRVIKGDATEFMKVAAIRHEKYEGVILDPPREGTTPEFVESCKTLCPSKIVYISCNPETLARDLRLFLKAGFKGIKATPVDMFPGVEQHVETVVLLAKQ